MKVFRSKYFWLMLCVCMLCAGMVECYLAARCADEISDGVFRLHVIANSDSKEDQELKLAVRDAVSVKLNEIFSEKNVVTKAQAIEEAENSREILTDIAEQVIKDNGFGYDVTCTTGREAFPTKYYENISLPAWEYDSLCIAIGEGVGQNWWCILFPQLCFTESVSGDINETELAELQKNMSEGAYQVITVSAGENEKAPVVIRFKIIEIIQSVKVFFFGEA